MTNLAKATPFFFFFFLLSLPKGVEQITDADYAAIGLCFLKLLASKRHCIAELLRSKCLAFSIRQGSDAIALSELK